MRSVIGLRDAQRVIHLCTMQVVGSCGDDTSISNPGAFKFFFHLRASFLQYGLGDLTTVPTVFVCCVNNHIRLRQLKNTAKTYCKPSDESYKKMLNQIHHRTHIKKVSQVCVSMMH